MSRNKLADKKFIAFDKVWIRLLEQTPIKKNKDLAKVVGINESVISTRKKENKFPAEWGFFVAQEYGLNTDWLLTGEGEAKKGELKEEDKILQEVMTWVKENSKKNESFKFWFIYELEQKFPDFKKWRRGKEQTTGSDVLDLFKQVSQNNSK